MAFRKRNTPLSRPSNPPPITAEHTKNELTSPISGVRPSPADGRRTTSTGTPSLDGLLAGHAGIPLGHGVLVEETGSTDYAGVLLRCYAAEGVMQGHHVHVCGAAPGWVKDLPGVVEGTTSREEGKTRSESERMKIAWRYERMGAVRERGACCPLAILAKMVRRCSYLHS